MDLFPILIAVAVVSVFAAASVVVRLFRRPSTKKERRRVPPEVPGAWPFIGHLLFYDQKYPPHLALGAMADAYGPIFMTKLGSLTTFVISSAEITKEVYTVHDKLLDRPGLIASKFLGYDGSFLSTKPCGPQWRELRKIAVTELLSSHRIEMQKNYRAREADVSFGNLWRLWESQGGPKNGVLVDMKREFQEVAKNCSLMMVAGKRCFGNSPNCGKDEAMRCRRLVLELVRFFSLDLFSDSTPYLAWLDWGIKRAMKRTAMELDVVLEGWIEEHKEKKKSGSGRSENDRDYMDVLMEIFEHTEIPGMDSRTTIKALCLNMILIGSETSIVVLVWALSLLANNPHVLKKAQEELDNIVGKDRVVEESDIKDLVYLQAIVKETFRLYPPIPLIALRHVMEDFDIAYGDFHIPAGTQVLLNEWKIQRDPNLWPDPERFKPERFLTLHTDVEMGRNNFTLFPFGLGRRSCPAIPLGLRMVQYLLARFLHSFDVSRPSSEELDMSESNGGFGNWKVTPLEVMITPRLHPHLYQLSI